RGMSLGGLRRRNGPRRAADNPRVVYGATHLATGNAAVTGAAASLGGRLSWMRANGAGIERLVLTHAFWVVPTLLWDRYRAPRDQDPARLSPARPETTTAGSAATAHGRPGEGAVAMTVTGGAGSTGRRVSRWSRLAQRANNVVHTGLYERTGGRFGTRLLGHEVGILTTTGRGDGQPYSVPLFTFHDGDDVLVVASYRGSAGHPAWYRNLLAEPDATIRIRDRSWPVHARVLDAEERRRWWARLVRDFDGYAAYQRRTTREIPVIRLAPRPRTR
ncbi:nitroreductase/quinone reductase family protein, partial [Streptomyces sp. NPDC058953]|uniref:nitroreductase/quinone reductase family protein n=1 Tax=Streptomyces sp. NPDC058953 TaxID=3346676 RepID=UPI00367C1BF8